MSEKNYSAGIVSQGFWFYEMKQYLELVNVGKSDQEIKQLSEENNIFAAVSASRANEIFNASRRRVKVLGSEMQTLFPKLNIDNQKLVALIAVLLLNDLFLEFMIEVFQLKIVKGELQLSPTDYKSFFAEKQRTNGTVAGWKPYTYSRLSSAYKNYLLESGLIRENGSWDTITPKVLDVRLREWLKSINRLDIEKAITGGF
ncbi:MULTISPECIES: DUF1819 family protein [Lactococcus]|uniref:DUF1819 family protein n=1 Tax=Lactococcus TaxID=1357 RepID=UPI00129E4E73|nr:MULTISPECIES: DUF1819 family protein [Lactococcus]MCT0056292.1 DUF1819 family protein [Lactococcus lactis subsp. lactis]MDT2863610.1 DUF1819 family protein [Lactococcus lactis]MDT2868569.1 DUF1819 family protein [Lactococcus lactis]MDT2885234.1 DUF1819 family protein [Lactococcus lactis]MDT2898816.1 DUF1819 family protein [Lactococcus lactis]